MPYFTTLYYTLLYFQIVLLNLLIAIMSDSYAKVRANSYLESQHERAMLLVELEALWLPLLAWARGPGHVYSSEKFPMWLHVLKATELTDVEVADRHLLTLYLRTYFVRTYVVRTYLPR